MFRLEHVPSAVECKSQTVIPSLEFPWILDLLEKETDIPSKNSPLKDG